jgi:lipoprotein signal peptidase
MYTGQTSRVGVCVIDLLVSGGAILLLDQWSKNAAVLLSTDRSISCAHFLRIRRLTNAKKIYRNRNIRIVMALVWLWALASAIVLRHSGLWFQGQVSLIGLGLAFGGAAGNLLDIWRLQSVVDFIDLRWWPVFNLADAGIVGGLLLAFWF